MSRYSAYRHAHFKLLANAVHGIATKLPSSRLELPFGPRLRPFATKALSAFGEPGVNGAASLRCQAVHTRAARVAVTVDKADGVASQVFVP